MSTEQTYGSYGPARAGARGEPFTGEWGSESSSVRWAQKPCISRKSLPELWCGRVTGLPAWRLGRPREEKPMPSFEDVLDRQLRDPEFRREWERTAIARAVANAVVAHRAKHGLTQRALATALDWKPSQVARLELGEHSPSLETMRHLSSRLGLRFVVEVSPPGVPRIRPRPAEAMEDLRDSDGTRVVVLTGETRASRSRPVTGPRRAPKRTATGTNSGDSRRTSADTRSGRPYSGEPQRTIADTILRDC